MPKKTNHPNKHTSKKKAPPPSSSSHGGGEAAAAPWQPERYRKHCFSLFSKKITVCVMAHQGTDPKRALKFFGERNFPFICLEKEAAATYFAPWPSELFHPIIIDDYAPISFEQLQRICKLLQQPNASQILLCCLSGCGRSGHTLIALHILSQFMKTPSLDREPRSIIPIGDYGQTGEVSVSTPLAKAWHSIKSQLPGVNDFPIERESQVTQLETFIEILQKFGVEEFMRFDFSNGKMPELREAPKPSHD